MYVNKKASVKIFENEIVNLISMDNDDESNSYTVNTMLWRKKEAILWQDLCRLASITGPPGLTLLVLHSP